MGGEPCLGGLPQPAPLLGPDHLGRVAERRPRLGLDLHEHDPPPPARDEIQLVAAGPGVRGEDPVAAEEVVQAGAPLDGRAGCAGVQPSPSQ